MPPKRFCILTTIILAGSAAVLLQAQTGLVFEQPLLLTSAGQNAEVQIASVLCRKAEITATLAKTATAKDLSNFKTLVLVLGASMKGLGSAGLDIAKERDRIKSLLAEAKAKSIPVLAMHLGGEVRRGEITDELIEEYLPAAGLAIVVKSGNKDGLFTRICRDRGIPLREVEKTLDALGPLKAAVKK